MRCARRWRRAGPWYRVVRLKEGTATRALEVAVAQGVGRPPATASGGGPSRRESSRPWRNRARSSGKGCRSMGERPETETLLVGAPRQPDSRVFRRRTPGAGIQPWRGHRAEDRACLPTALRLRFAARVPAEAAQAAFGGVVVHGRVVDEHCQAVAVAQQGVQASALRFAFGKFVSRLLRCREERSGELCELLLGGSVARARQTPGVETVP